MASDRRNYKQVVETTVELAQKAGVSDIVGRIANDLKDENEPYRKMVMETIQQVISTLGAADIDERLEVRLIDGIIYAFESQTTEDNIMLDGVGTVVNALGECSARSPCPLWLTYGVCRHPRQALPHPDCFHCPLASQQQVCQGSSTGS